MSGQWQPDVSQGESFTCFKARMEKAILKMCPDLGRAHLHDKVDQLLPNEIEIALVYIDSLIKTRPIKDGLTPGYDHLHEENDWGVCRICAQRKAGESRAHMAVLELENDPR